MAHIAKSATLTGVLYFSNIYWNALYLYSTLMSVIDHLLHILSLGITVTLLNQCCFLSFFSQNPITAVVFVCYLGSTT